MLLHEVAGVTLPRNIDERRNSLRDYLGTKSFDEQVDPATRSFDAAYLSAWNEFTVVAELSDILLSKQRKPDLQYIAEFLPRAFVALMLQYDAEHLYATGDVTPAFERLQHDEGAQFSLSLNLGRPIQSNIGNREWLLSWALQTFGLLDDRPIVEYGTSGQAIGKKMTEIALGNMTHHEVQMMERRRVGAANRLIHNPVMTRLMHQVVSRPEQQPPRWYGLDMFSPADPTVRHWVRSCSQYLTDWTNESKRAEFDHLQSLHPANVMWRYADFSGFDRERYNTMFPDEAPPRAIYIPYSIYELPSDKARKQTLDQAVEIVSQTGDGADGDKQGGIVVVLDDIQSISPDNSIKIVPRRRDFSTCGGWIYHSRLPEAGFQKYFSFDSGRLNRAIPESGVAVSGIMAALGRGIS